MKKLFYLAAAITVMASCTSNEYLGEVGPNGTEPNDGAIRFGSSFKGMTRADHYGADAAGLLYNKFIVGGFKGATGTSTTFKADGTIDATKVLVKSLEDMVNENACFI